MNWKRGEGEKKNRKRESWPKKNVSVRTYGVEVIHQGVLEGSIIDIKEKLRNSLMGKLTDRKPENAEEGNGGNSAKSASKAGECKMKRCLVLPKKSKRTAERRTWNWWKGVQGGSTGTA